MIDSGFFQNIQKLCNSIFLSKIIITGKYFRNNLLDQFVRAVLNKCEFERTWDCSELVRFLSSFNYITCWPNSRLLVLCVLWTITLKLCISYLRIWAIKSVRSSRKWMRWWYFFESEIEMYKLRQPCQKQQ